MEPSEHQQLVDILASAPGLDMLGEDRPTRELVAAAEQALPDIDRAVARAQLVLNEALAKQKAVKSILKRHQAALPSAQRVPCDVLVEIFFHGVEKEANGEAKARDFFGDLTTKRIRQKNSQARYQGQKEPVNFSQVCRVWRNVCLNTPQLWSTPSFAGNGSAVMFRNHALGLAEWIKRSGGQPLSVELRYKVSGGGPKSYDGFMSNPNEGWTNGLRTLLNLLVREAWRLQSLIVDVPYNLVHTTGVMDRVSFDMPELRHFSIGGNNKLHLDVMTRINATQAPIKKENLVAFVFSGVICKFSMRDLVTLLQGCPALRKLVIEATEGRGLERAWVGFAQPIRHDQLRELTLFQTDGLSSMLNSLCLPRLEFLSLEALDDYHRDYVVNSALSSFLQRSQPPLKSLSLEDVMFTLEDLGASFRHIPSLMALRIARMRMSEETLGPLYRVGNNNRDCLPKLENLSFEDCPHLDMEMVADIIVSRRDPENLGSRPGNAERGAARMLRHVIIHRCDSVDDIRNGWEIAPCIAQGLTLSFLPGPSKILWDGRTDTRWMDDVEDWDD